MTVSRDVDRWIERHRTPGVLIGLEIAAIVVSLGWMLYLLQYYEGWWVHIRPWIGPLVVFICVPLFHIQDQLKFNKALKELRQLLERGDRV